MILHFSVALVSLHLHYYLNGEKNQKNSNRREPLCMDWIYLSLFVYLYFCSFSATGE